MSPLLLRRHTLLDTRQSSNGTATPASQPPAPVANGVVFVLCIVFGALLGCVLIAIAIYFARRRKHKKHNTTTLSREGSFQAGVPSVIEMIPAPRTRRPSARIRTSPLPRIAIPSPELGSTFRFDPASNLMGRGSRRGSAQRVSVGSIPGSTPTPAPTPAPTPMPKASSPRHESLVSTGSTLVGPASPFDKYDMPLRVINPTPLTPLNTITEQLQKPNPVYRRGGSSPSRERLVTSTASADSLFSGSTNTPPLSPPSTWSQPGTRTINSPTDAISPAASVALRKSLSQQSAASAAFSPQIALADDEMSPYLVDFEHAPRAPSAGRVPLSSARAVGRTWTSEDAPPGVVGTPVTLSHFPFRFSSLGPTSPALSSIAYGSPVPSSNIGVYSPTMGHSYLNVPKAQGHGLGFLNTNGRWSLPAHSTPSLKLKIKHAASDEIIAVAFAPQSINFQAVREAVRARLGFQPEKLWNDEPPAGRVDIIDDASLWSWLDEQYTKGHTRLILHVE